MMIIIDHGTNIYIEQGRWKHFSFGQAKYSGGRIPLCWTGMIIVEWTMEWTMEFTLFIAIYSTLLCSYLLTKLLTASSTLYWFSFVQPSQSCRGQGRTHI